MLYKSEAAFGHAVDEALRSKGYDVHNIQTPTTERGCPDRYIQKDRLSAWIELKKVNGHVNETLIVPYREGQQAWLYRHHKHGGRGFTMIAGVDGILIFLNKEVLEGKMYRQGCRPQLIISHLYSTTLDKWLQTFAY